MGAAGDLSDVAARRQARQVVSGYLEQVSHRSSGPSRQLRRVAERIEAINGELVSASALRRLSLLQERKELNHQRKQLEADDLEEDFEAVAAAFSAQRGIEWSTWRASGVPVEVLRRAGVPREHKKGR